MNSRILDEVRKRLSSRQTMGYLYGSTLVSPGMNRDIDLVIVCEESEKPTIRQSLQLLQTSLDVLLHTLLVSQEELGRNASLRRLIENARRLW